MVKKYIDRIKNQLSDLSKQKDGHLGVINDADEAIKTLTISKERDWCLFNQWVEVKVREKKYIDEITRRELRLNFKLSLYAVMASF